MVYPRVTLFLPWTYNICTSLSSLLSVSLCLSACLSVSVYLSSFCLCLSVCLPVCVSVCLSVFFLSLCLLSVSLCLSACLSVSVSLCLSLSPSLPPLSPSFPPSSLSPSLLCLCLSLCLSVSVCLSVCLSRSLFPAVCTARESSGKEVPGKFSVTRNNYATEEKLCDTFVSRASRLTFPCLYTTPLSDIIPNHSVNHQLFADDIQLQKSTPPNDVQSLTHDLQSCTDGIKAWMCNNQLKFNQT